MKPLVPCGTTSARKRHLRRGEAPCQPCKDAQAAYQRQRREDPEIRADENARKAARDRAVWRLVAEHRERFRELFIEEVTRDG